ncbi:hypothetical protein [Caldithrix abyssi]|uniref:ABC-2 family transporter protein n=1 Tax=Caldithrix abyssi DSM 13497 TaxID=880073 RepID=H1XXJ5_CALAY|nr:hypothetical protein [Caldithrix abyssi]EHO43119.1 hypothetical protein Calab_3520 [Caldithrix abyssi DSM 13497]
MVKALFYKEWLKVRSAVFILAGLFIVLVIKIALEISYNIRFLDANKFWYQVIILGDFYFDDLKFFPLLIGLVIAFAQYMPEINANRLKLTLHLPLKENSILLFMVGFGTLAFFAVNLLGMGLFSIVTARIFPWEFLFNVWITIAPWVLAGFTIYWAAAAIFVEPIWLKRIVLIIFSFGYLFFLFYTSAYSMYKYSLPWFIITSLFFSVIILYTGQRFRRGVEK